MKMTLECEDCWFLLDLVTLPDKPSLEESSQGWESQGKSNLDSAGTRLIQKLSMTVRKRT